MQAISLLTLVILVGFLINNNKSPYARVIIGSIFGVFYFSIWPFSVYYIEIFDLSENHKIIAYATISVFATATSIILIKAKFQLAAATSSFIIFILAMLITQTSETHIKNKISIYSGYFDKSTPKTTHYTNHTKATTSYTHTGAGYDVKIQNEWIKKNDKGPMFIYFQLINNDNLVAEFRPKCFNKNNVALPEIVESIRDINNNLNLHSDVICYHTETLMYACKVSTFSDSKELKRINWFGIQENTTKGIELDFVLYDHQKKIIDSINRILNSLTITTPTNSDATCLGLTEWL